MDRYDLILWRLDFFVGAAVATGAAVVGIVAGVVVAMHSTFVGFSEQLIQLGSNGATSQVTAATKEGTQ